MSLKPRSLHQYHVFLASPGDVGAERQYVRKFFDEYNRHTAHIFNARFDVVDWDNYSTIGVGRPQELITGQTLERYRDSLALVVGIMGQRFGSPTGKAESGTEEELRRVAAFMQAGPGGLQGNMIDGPALTRLIEDYLQSELHFAQSRAAAGAVVEQLRQRNFILCFVGADSYAFVYRTFLEYFCAADIVHQFNVAKTLDIDGLIALFDEHCRQDEWREVLRLICGQIDEQFVGRIVEHLAARTDLAKWDRLSLPEMPLAILLLNWTSPLCSEIRENASPTRQRGSCRNSFPRLRAMKLRYLETRRVSEGKTGIALSLANASGFNFRRKTDSAQLQNLRVGLVCCTKWRCRIMKCCLRFRICAALISCFSGAAGKIALAKHPSAVMQSRCVDCHNSDDRNGDGDVDLTVLLTSAKPADPRPAEMLWTRVEEMVASRQMPPADETPLNDAERDSIVAWYRANYILRNGKDHIGVTPLRRLTRYELENTLEELLSIKLKQPYVVSPESGGLLPSTIEQLYEDKRQAVFRVWRAASNDATANQALLHAMKIAMLSPSFIYRMETSRDAAEPYAVGAHESAV